MYTNPILFYQTKNVTVKILINTKDQLPNLALPEYVYPEKVNYEAGNPSGLVFWSYSGKHA